ncbi:hypothetical protein C8Q76DRAFT_620824 [Earliella scabrosa]|nr:hypothetical protein C8Q76DRAFT_620824 [Earliella scabrosa]
MSQRDIYVQRVLQGVMYQVGQTRPHLVLVSSSNEWDPACGAEPTADDLVLQKWFCQRVRIDHVNHFPGTTHRLANGYDIVTVRQIREMFSVKWRGNIIVLKRARRDQDQVVNITRPEVSLINALVHRCVLQAPVLSTA